MGYKIRLSSSRNWIHSKSWSGFNITWLLWQPKHMQQYLRAENSIVEYSCVLFIVRSSDSVHLNYIVKCVILYYFTAVENCSSTKQIYVYFYNV